MTPRTSLVPNEIASTISRLSEANKTFMQRYRGESSRRQPVHTVYGGAHLFRSDSARRLGEVALQTLDEYASTPEALAKALDLPADSALPAKIYQRIVEKLKREPVEDFRLDFEDGYGNRPDQEEDSHARSSALEVAHGMRERSLPPFVGIRIKPLNEDLRARSIRTLDLFITTLAGETSGRLPDNFVVTLPKIQVPEQVRAATEILAELEGKTNLPAESLKIELMIETPQAIINSDGAIGLHSLVDAANGRCGSIHFGVYDYTASCGITASHQAMGHPVCDFARQMMLVAMAGTGIHLSDGATNILPVGPYRAEKDHPLEPGRQRANQDAIHQAWRLGFQNNLHSLGNGFYQGWDLHPAQLVTRYAAIYLFFLSGLESAASRLKAFVEKAALASLFGDVFDDAATGQGLLNFFLRGLACGAITETEALATGLTLEDLRSRSFLKILQSRRRK